MMMMNDLMMDVSLSESTIKVFVDRSLSLGGGRTRVEVSRWGRVSVGALKQAINRQLDITSTTHTLLFVDINLEALEHDDQLLSSIGITDGSSVFLTLDHGTLSLSLSFLIVEHEFLIDLMFVD